MLISKYLFLFVLVSQIGRTIPQVCLAETVKLLGRGKVELFHNIPERNIGERESV